MKITQEQYEKISKYLPKQHGNVKWDSRHNLYRLTNRRHNQHQGQYCVFGQYNSESTPRRLRSFKKRGKQAIGRSRGGLTTKIHMVTASAKFAVSFSLSSGSANDSPQGMKLLHFTPKVTDKQFILMDRAYAGKRLRTTAVELGYEPVVF